MPTPNLRVYLSGANIRLELVQVPLAPYSIPPSALRYEAVYSDDLAKHIIYIKRLLTTQSGVFEQALFGAPFDQIVNASDVPYSITDYLVTLAALEGLGIALNSVDATLVGQPAQDISNIALYEKLANWGSIVGNSKVYTWFLNGSGNRLIQTIQYKTGLTTIYTTTFTYDNLTDEIQTETTV